MAPQWGLRAVVCCVGCFCGGAGDGRAAEPRDIHQQHGHQLRPRTQPHLRRQRDPHGLHLPGRREPRQHRDREWGGHEYLGLSGGGYYPGASSGTTRLRWPTGRAAHDALVAGRERHGADARRVPLPAQPRVHRRRRLTLRGQGCGGQHLASLRTRQTSRGRRCVDVPLRDPPPLPGPSRLPFP